MLLQRVVGVCFEGRQKAIADLKVGDDVMMVVEDDNPHDPRAVSVRDMEGRSLGYIPRDATAGARRYIVRLGGKCKVYEHGVPPTFPRPFLVIRMETKTG